jgi:hypothetical protein
MPKSAVFPSGSGGDVGKTIRTVLLTRARNDVQFQTWIRSARDFGNNQQIASELSLREDRMAMV